MKKVLSMVLAVVVLFALTIPAFAAGSKTDPVEIAETTYDRNHQDWTEDEPSVEPSDEEASEATDVPEEEIDVIWTVDYDTENYPADVTIDAPGTDGLTIYILEYIDGEWVVIGEGTGPSVTFPVQQGGTISVVVRHPQPQRPAKDTTAKAPKTGDNSWLIATAAVTAVAIAGAIVMTKRKEQ